MPRKLDDGSLMYTLGIPHYETDPTYIGILMGLLFKLGNILSSPEYNYTDLRVEAMTHFLISLVIGEKKAQKLRNELQSLIEERLNKEQEKTGEALTNEQIGRIRHMTCIEFINRIINEVDTHLGIATEHQLGFVVKKDWIKSNKEVMD